MINSRGDSRLEIAPVEKFIESKIRNIIVSPIKDKNQKTIGVLLCMNKIKKKRFENDDMILQKYMSMIFGSIVYSFVEDESQIAAEYSLRRIINFTHDFSRYASITELIV
mmetsp:Transcript_39826/g.45700  ORF Transcript_39826/g.45700 Transcript_39826/m.45700 type:complete len:110 (-) Transcript_39826:223-552(-)